MSRPLSPHLLGYAHYCARDFPFPATPRSNHPIPKMTSVTIHCSVVGGMSSRLSIALFTTGNWTMSEAAAHAIIAAPRGRIQVWRSICLARKSETATNTGMLVKDQAMSHRRLPCNVDPNQMMLSKLPIKVKLNNRQMGQMRRWGERPVPLFGAVVRSRTAIQARSSDDRTWNSI